MAILAISAADFSRKHDIPKHTISRHAEKFQWAKIEGLLHAKSQKILDNAKNAAVAKSLNESRVRRFRKTSAES